MTDLLDFSDTDGFSANGTAVSGREQAPATAPLSPPIPQLAVAAQQAVAQAGLARWFQLAAKRGFDIAVSGAALILMAPFFAIVVFLIKRESPGPAIFVQERWGLGMRKIRVYKFRSMHLDKCDLSGVAQTIPDDPRVTRIGRVLRRTNIDELPQLFNVFKGDMSLVGPRCHPIGMKAAGQLYEDLVPEYHYRHLMRPGITGLAQVRGFRGPTTDPNQAVARVACDLRYVATFNIVLDITLLVSTVFKELRRGSGL